MCYHIISQYCAINDFSCREKNDILLQDVRSKIFVFEKKKGVSKLLGVEVNSIWRPCLCITC